MVDIKILKPPGSKLKPCILISYSKDSIKRRENPEDNM